MAKKKKSGTGEGGCCEAEKGGEKGFTAAPDR